MTLRTHFSTSVQTGDTIANTNTETNFTQQLSIPIRTGSANIPIQYGTLIRVTGYGYISTDATPGTLTINCNLYTSSTKQKVSGTGAFTPPANLSNAQCKIEGFAVYNGGGTNAVTARFDGTFTIQGSANGPLAYGIVNTGSGTTGFTGSLNINNQTNSLRISVTWSSALATNTITMSNLVFEQLTNED